MSITEDITEFRSKKVTIMGLGLHGGGISSARFFARAGAHVTVTDLRDQNTLAPAIEQLQGLDIRFVLGAHREQDFSDADIVIKNPAVRRDSPYLKVAKRIETDISIFLRYSQSPLIAVTGSKGKSTVASAIWHVLSQAGKTALLGGNITVSPLDFLDKTAPDVPVVLELSSWQLGDLRGMGLLKPQIAVLTTILPDHLNYYGSMDAYVADKRVIYQAQDETCYTICNADQNWGRSFAQETRATVLWYSEKPLEEAIGAGAQGGWLALDILSQTKEKNAEAGAPHSGHVLDPKEHPELYAGYGTFGTDYSHELLVPQHILVPGLHQKKNLLAAAVALRAFGLSAKEIAPALGSFPGVPHRLEYVAEIDGVRWYNDSTATIPDAAIAAINSFSCPVVLIAGGSDKSSDFSAFAEKARSLKDIILLAGSGTDRIIALLEKEKISYKGPYNSMRDAVDSAAQSAARSDVVLLSPGCASFGLFLHEFERGDLFKKEVFEISARAHSARLSPAEQSEQSK